MSNSCLISVGVMSYNQERYIRHTLDCILAQQCSYPFEIVIGDDGSKDNSRRIIGEYQQKYPGMIKLLPEAPNKGILRNYADIVKACSGKYITFCHCDDFWHDPLKLEKQVGFLEQNPEYEFVHTDANVYIENLDRTIPAFNSLHQKYIPDGDVFESFFTNKFFIFTVSTCYTKAVIDKYVDFDEFERADFMYEDLPTWIELSRHVKFKYMNDPMVTYRVVEDSHSHPKQRERKFVLLQAHYKMKEFFIRKYNIDEKIQIEFGLQFHRNKFNIAYNLNNHMQAEDSFNYLKKHGQVNLKTRAKKMVLDIPVLYKSLKSIKNLNPFKNPVTSS
jgi:glycosyltransferase involved in cell wall biosynthesis